MPAIRKNAVTYGRVVSILLFIGLQETKVAGWGFRVGSQKVSHKTLKYSLVY